MSKQEYYCARCGAVVFRYACSVGKKVYCSPTCRGLDISKRSNPAGYTKHPHLTKLNKEINSTRMTPETRTKLRQARLDTGEGKTYAKRYSRHEHRIVAEQILGRPLVLGETVHHIDGNKRNNDPANIQIYKSQAEHAREHMLKRYKKEVIL